MSCNLSDSNTSLGFGISIMVVMLITYLPQFLKIKKYESVYGISGKMILLGNIANFYSFLGTLLSDWDKMFCCGNYDVTGIECANIIVAFLQIAWTWILMIIYLDLFLKYMLIEEMSLNISIGSREHTTYKYYSKLYGYLMMMSGFIAIIFMASYSPDDDKIQTLGDIYNIFSVIFCVIQWTPQIYETYYQKRLGSLSLLSLTLQTPGSFAIFFYQYVLNKTRFSVGGPFLVSGIQMLILTCMGYYYHYFNYKSGLSHYERI